MPLKLRKPDRGTSGALVSNMLEIPEPEQPALVMSTFYSGQATDCCRERGEDDEYFKPSDYPIPSNADLGLPAGYRRTAFEEQVFFSARANTDPLIESAMELQDSDFDELDGSYLYSLGEEITFSIA